jgi:hypothetical protein
MVVLQKMAELDGFWWLAGGKTCGNCGLLMVVFGLLKTCQFWKDFCGNPERAKDCQ